MTLMQATISTQVSEVQAVMPSASTCVLALLTSDADTEETLPETEQQIKEQTPASSHQ